MKTTGRYIPSANFAEKENKRGLERRYKEKIKRSPYEAGEATRRKILAVIDEYAERNAGHTPTFRYLEENVGIVLSSVHYHVDRLVQRGELYVTPDGHLARTNGKYVVA